MKETVTVPQMLMLWAGYILAEIGTFAFLMWDHWPTTPDGWETATLIVWSACLTLIWPIYWGLLHWIM